MASVNRHKKQIAANNPITNKSEANEYIQEMTLDYNLCLLFGEEPMSEAEMREYMEEKLGGGKGEEKHPDPCDYEDLDPEKYDFTRKWEEIRKALGGVEKVGCLTAREYYLAKRGDL